MVALTTPQLNENWVAPDFNLKATDGNSYNLEKARGENGLVIMFICNHCPFVQAIAHKIANDTNELKEIGINSIAIMSNDTDTYPEDSFDNMKIFAKQQGFTFPYVIDETQQIAKAYDAVCTPDFFGFNKDLELKYRGRLDDSGMKQKENSNRDLFNAMSEIAKQGHTTSTQYPSIGCSIKWRD